MPEERGRSSPWTAAVFAENQPQRIAEMDA